LGRLPGQAGHDRRPFAAGGPTDKVARDLAEALRKPMSGQPIIIENVGGAGGTLGAAKVARAPNDGYTLLLHHIGMSTAPALYRKMSYDTLGDFEYLGMINEVPMTLIGKPTLPANNYAELAKWIESNKGKINLANCRPRRCVAPVRPAVPEHRQGRDADGSLQGHRPGDDRPARRPGRPDVRPDHQHHGQIETGKVKAYAVTTRSG
jgi:hypothetical protein